MGIEKKYFCNLCRDLLYTDSTAALNRRPIGIWHSSVQRGWVKTSWRETENHLCVNCIASIQAMPKLCGQGFECNGGLQCGSDHK